MTFDGQTSRYSVSDRLSPRFRAVADDHSHDAFGACTRVGGADSQLRGTAYNSFTRSRSPITCAGRYLGFSEATEMLQVDVVLPVYLLLDDSVVAISTVKRWSSGKLHFRIPSACLLGSSTVQTRMVSFPSRHSSFVFKCTIRLFRGSPVGVVVVMAGCDKTMSACRMLVSAESRRMKWKPCRSNGRAIRARTFVNNEVRKVRYMMEEREGSKQHACVSSYDLSCLAVVCARFTLYAV